ncbi:MAG: aminoacyl-tRNA hydrolase [Candidatus Delongbacteria bacterium]|jgi:PTH1 family peptidyl-tRNA hydrolase|nr:aminoacyl-tRNA hydrolase [Candidatus Delongbacteria bacterium]
MQIIIGLGNPGVKYSNTWHNLGFMAVDKFAIKHDLNYKAGKGKYYSATGFVNFKKVVIVKPVTYMNLSGIAVREILDYYGVDVSDALVVYDDINLDIGSVRIRKSGTAGGHNGIKSIINSLGTNEFPRLRIGFRTNVIASILDKNPSVLPDVVLSRIPDKMNEEIEISLERSIDSIEMLLDKGIDKTMNYFNTKNEL